MADTQQQKTPTPGSDEAVKKGCTCRVMDNAHGKGTYGVDGHPVFWINGDCPLHALVFEHE